MKKCLAIPLAALLLTSLLPRGAAASGKCVQCEKWKDAGFPDAYCTSLCALSLLHPTWEFEALPVTELSRGAGKNYTFSFVLEEECRVAERSLVSASAAYLPYQREGSTLSDTGYRQANREAVAYFLDPTSHLSESGVFQFLLLTDTALATEESIASALKGSAAEGLVDAGFLLELGREKGIDPHFLAVRLFQEQGTEGSVLLKGNAGDRLWEWYEKGVQTEEGRYIATPATGYEREELLSLNGYFNPFHASASGNGAFAVYYAGAKHAQKMGWDTLEKGIAGGIEKLSTEYLSRYQNTLYLQKWNVDVRSVFDTGESRNFLGQYMQNIGAAKTEGDRLFSLYREKGLFNLPLHFLIPVYEEMPFAPSPDPAAGSVAAFASEPLLSSPHSYEAVAVMLPTEEEDVPQQSRLKEEEEQEKSVFLDILVLLAFFISAFLVVTVYFAFARFFFPRILPKIRKNWQK